MPRLPGSALAILALLSAAPAAAAEGPSRPPPARVVELQVTSAGFVPAEVKVKAGEPVKLVVTRKTDRTCATEIVLKDLGIEKPLPLGRPVEVAFTPAKPGKVRYTCGMGMVGGVVTVE